MPRGLPARAFLGGLAGRGWEGCAAAAFDTRYAGDPGRTGSAAAGIARRLSAARPRSENVGCAYSMSPRAMTSFTHRLMQAERTWNGPHWRNMRDPDWVSAVVGIGMSGNETRIV
ncbi:MAG: hypothetical protein ACKOTZ_13570, partial [Chloroflexota bacterium]